MNTLISYYAGGSFIGTEFMVVLCSMGWEFYWVGEFVVLCIMRGCCSRFSTRFVISTPTLAPSVIKLPFRLDVNIFFHFLFNQFASETKRRNLTKKFRSSDRNNSTTTRLRDESDNRYAPGFQDQIVVHPVDVFHSCERVVQTPQFAVENAS